MSQQAVSDPNHLAWLDMEMTGLSPGDDRIIEVAIVITNSKLEVLAQSDALAVHQSDERLAAMDKWNQSTHARSGLIDRVKASTLDEAAVEKQMLDFLKAWVPANSTPMCGNSICQDRRFMANYMPNLEAYFHYRNLDVSTLKELCKRWQPQIARAFNKRGAHTALADILESIDELRHYRDNFLLMPDSESNP
ncbi:MAG: oligoribonuclease [Burkholderiaceae bacterium]